jgi:hypothetical protein
MKKLNQATKKKQNLISFKLLKTKQNTKKELKTNFFKIIFQ